MIVVLGIATFLSFAFAICPSQYELNKGLCIRALILEQHQVYKDDVPEHRKECQQDGATLPIIKDYDTLEKFKSIANSFSEISGSNIYIVMDLECNGSTRHLQWIEDGSKVDYAPGIKDYDSFDCVSKDETFVARVKDNDFTDISVHKTHTITVLCSVAPTEPTTTTATTTTETTTTPTTTTQTTTTPTTTSMTTTSTTVKPTTTATTVNKTTAKATTTPRTSPVVTTPHPATEKCGNEYTWMETAADLHEPCYKVYTERFSWDSAQKQCTADFGSLVTINSADENKYFWRTAISNNFIGGIHIGAHQPTSDTSKWTWIDGEVPIDGKIYNNFIGAFPIPGGGECASMLTEASSALWINEDCDDNRLPFICRREDFEDLPKYCPNNEDAPKPGVDFFPPGFPNPSIPCEYFLVVAAKKIVELVIEKLEADVTKDYLEVLEGTSGFNLLANLTGSILTPNKIRTAKSNVMRVNWMTDGTGNGKGFKMRYNEIEP